MLSQETRKQQIDTAPGTLDIGDASEWQQESFWSFSPPAFRPVAVENPGGGRIRDKRDPDISDTVVVDGHLGRRVRLHRLAAEAWKAMVGAARAAGIAAPLFMPVSGYRSTARQRVLFAKAVKKYGSEQKARRWVAKPGGSAHHSGRTIDLYLGYRISSRNVRQMRKTGAWKWLRDNAQRFGFYPYEAEPWHWEYNPRSSSVSGVGTGGAVAGALGVVGSLPSLLSSAISRGSEVATTVSAIANGNRDANSLTSELFYARHPERNRRRIGRNERQAAKEWFDIRNRLVRPLLQKLAASGATVATDTRPSGISSVSASHGSLIEMRNGGEVFRQPFTSQDILWTARFITGEAGGRDDLENAAVIQAMFNRYALFTRRVYSSFQSFIRAYSTTLQPVLNSVGAARRHMNSPNFVRTGGHYSKDPRVPKGQLQRHLDLQRRAWNALPMPARQLATRALTGQMPNPGIGLASEFASTRIFFRSKFGREPSVQEWRAYTRSYARSNNRTWVGDVPNLNQRKNAFFLDRRVQGRPSSDVRVAP